MALAIVFPPATLHAQRTENVTIQATGAIPDSTVAGVVYDARDGKPILGAAVIILPKGPQGITDALGRFKISLSGIRDSVVRVRALALAYRPQDTMVAVGKPGLGLSIGLNPGPAFLCKSEELVFSLPGGLVGRPQDVTVNVRDLLSGVAPKSPVLMVVADSAAVDTAMIPVAKGEYVSGNAGTGLGQGALTITIGAVGYQSWKLSGIQRDDCGKAIGSPFQIWLLPKE